MISLKTIVTAWNRFFFEPVSPVSIAVFRIAFGFLLFVNFLLMIPDVEVWFFEKGTLSQATAPYVSGGAGLKLFPLLPPGDGWVWAYFVVCMLLAITLTVGFQTRISTILLFLLMVGLHHRNPLILNSGDSFFRISLFFLIFTPAGAIYSVDHFLRVRGGKASRSPVFCPPWAQRLIQIQLALVYFYTFVWKCMGTMWLDGSAIYYTSRLMEFWRFPVPYLNEHMWTIKLMTWGTLIVEFALGVLIWIKEFRYWVLLGGVLLHLGIDYSMNIPLFGPTMMAAYLTFVDPEHMERVITRMKAVFRKERVQPELKRISVSTPVAPVSKSL
jgi:hypothetical protein